MTCLLQSPEKTLIPSPEKQVERTGAWCVVTALGSPRNPSGVSLTSQHLTVLSHDEAIK